MRLLRPTSSRWSNPIKPRVLLEKERSTYSHVELVLIILSTSVQITRFVDTWIRYCRLVHRWPQEKRHLPFSTPGWLIVGLGMTRFWIERMKNGEPDIWSVGSEYNHRASRPDMVLLFGPLVVAQSHARVIRQPDHPKTKQSKPPPSERTAAPPQSR